MKKFGKMNSKNLMRFKKIELFENGKLKNIEEPIPGIPVGPQMAHAIEILNFLINEYNKTHTSGDE